MLNQLFLKAPVNQGELAKLIINQNYIGSIIQQSDLDDESVSSDDEMDTDNLIFGITTAINLTKNKDTPVVEEIVKYLIARAETNAKDSVVTFLRDILSSPAKCTGLLINERFINIPPQISLPLFENLHKEIKRAASKKMPFDFVYYVMILKMYRRDKKKNKPAEDTYSNQEEEIFLKDAVVDFEFSVQNEKDSGLSGDWLEEDPTLTPYRKVIVFDANKLPDIIESIKEFIV